MELDARAIMSHPVICAREAMSVRELIDLLREKRISGVPVVSAEQRLVGVISITDLISLATEGSDAEQDSESDFHTSPAMDGMAAANGLLEPEEEVLDRPVREFMSRRVITAFEDTPVGRLADLMLSHRIHRLIIVRGEEIAGIVSVRDILRSLRHS